MRSVIDTGVFVSALIRKQGTTGDVLRALRDGRFTVIYTTDIVVEIIDVLGRPPFRTKYHIEPDDITALVNLIRLRGELVNPGKKVTAFSAHTAHSGLTHRFVRCPIRMTSCIVCTVLYLLV